MRVSVSKSGAVFSVSGGQSLLDAALAAGLRVPHGCRGGNCGACRARLVSGEVHYPRGVPLGLADAERAAGFILLCQAQAAGDLCLQVSEQRSPEQAMVKRLPCRIERILPLAPEVVAVTLKLPAAEPLNFEPGQYIDLLLPQGQRRSFSIASDPGDGTRLELHVRCVAGGACAELLLRPDAPGTLLHLEGPFGEFRYQPPQEDTPGVRRPLLLVAGGTGLAPLRAILRRALAADADRPAFLYWGARGPDDLYAHADLQDLARRVPKLRYVPVLSDAPPGWRGRRGWVHEAALADLAQLAPFDVYVCGPPPMMAAVRRDYPRHGVDARRLFIESFDYAPRQASSAATKS